MTARFRTALLSSLVFIVPAAALGQSGAEDVVYLNNGGVTRGLIIEQVPNQSLKIRTRDGNVFVYQISEIQKIAKESQPGFSYQLEERRSPGMAFALSLVVAGGGQYYNGQIGKGVVMTALEVGGYVLFFTQAYSPCGKLHEDTSVGPFGQTLYLGTYHCVAEGNKGLQWGGLAMSLASSIWSLFDAPLTAERMNREAAARRHGHLFEFDAGEQVVGFDLGPSRDGAQANLQLHF